MAKRFICLPVWVSSPELGDRVAADAYAAGASGLEEREGSPIQLLVYAPAVQAAQLLRALEPWRNHGVQIGEPGAVAEVDWSEAWREGLTATVISPRLAVRPSFVEPVPVPGQAVLVIDPGQAFGTGGHASTRLALVALDALDPARLAGIRLLDVGSGSGVLALSALALGAARAVAFDLDPLAARATLENARGNGLDDRLDSFCGGFEALAPEPAGGRFGGVVANLLRTEVTPLLDRIAGATSRGGFAIFSGLLTSEGVPMEERLTALGLETVDRHSEQDATGDSWLSLVTRRIGGS